jgi:hypothetical protein
MVKVHAEVIFNLQDQPERRGANYLMLGSGGHSPRWLKSCNYNKLSNVIQSCARYYTKNKHKLKYLSGIQGIHYHYPDDDDDSGKKCGQCLDWDPSNNKELGSFSPPNDYPNTKYIVNGMLQEKDGTYDGLSYAVETTHIALVDGSWEKKHAFSFFGVETVNKKATYLICEHAMNCRNYTYYETNQELYPEYFAAINDLRVSNPSLFGM